MPSPAAGTRPPPADPDLGLDPVRDGTDPAVLLVVDMPLPADESVEEVDRNTCGLEDGESELSHQGLNAGVPSLSLRANA